MSPSLAGGFLTTGEAQTGFTCSVPQQGRISYGREGLCPLQLQNPANRRQQELGEQVGDSSTTVTTPAGFPGTV